MAEHSNGAFRTSIGGQALIEGILMRGPDRQAIVVRDKDGQLVEKRTLKLPERIRGVLRCKNPRCITSVEQELPQEFVLTDREKRVYRPRLRRGLSCVLPRLPLPPPCSSCGAAFFARFYFITIMYTLFESKIAIFGLYMLKSLFATGVVKW